MELRFFDKDAMESESDKVDGSVNFVKWNYLSPVKKANLHALQGVHHLRLEDVDVKDSKSMKSVPSDAKTIGEVMIRGNTVMNGYFKDVKATKSSYKGGWFRSGDLLVRHQGGCIEVKDRSIDTTISGLESITAVVGKLDDHWGETSCAFVKLKNGCNANTDEIIKYCRDRLPQYIAPRTIIFVVSTVR
uniref:AMP-binding enzyme C-terminal domain-containing protein n=1 Tax=Solanum lycopersicum TaxID=4081 RepID=K4CYI7_SOLLC